MKLVIDIPNDEIPVKQEVKNIFIVFCGKHITQVRTETSEYEFTELPQVHSGLIYADSISEIRAEIEDLCNSCDDYRFVGGLNMAILIIDKHISGKE